MGRHYARGVRIAVVLNPNSRKNRRDGVREEPLRRAVGSWGEVFVTRDPSELDAVLREVLDDELACLVSVGGDGALHWALNAARPIARERGIALPVVLPTNGGTIDFVARRAGVRGRAETLLPKVVARLDAGVPLETVTVDSLDLELESDVGERTPKLGFALAAAGIGQRFFDEYYRAADPGPGTIVSVIGRTVASLAGGVLPGSAGARAGAMAGRMFAPFAARVTIDGEEVPAEKHGAIHAGAFGINLGNVLRVFPLADEEGAMHVQAGEATGPQIVANLHNLARGGRILAPGLRDDRGSEMVVEATSDESMRPVIDGELYDGVRRLAVRLGQPVRVARV